MKVNLRSVVTAVQELAVQLVPDEPQRNTLRQKFLRNLEEVEHVLIQELGASTDETFSLQRVKAAKQRLEDMCLGDLSLVCGNTGLKHTFSAMRRLAETDVMNESDDAGHITVDESSRLLGLHAPKSPGPEMAKNCGNRLMQYFPIIKWTKNYSFRHDLPGDLFAGCTVAFMTFPQTMGYAMLAGLPPIYGLYAAFVPVFIYAMLGTSAEMSVGPAAMVALMIPSTISHLAPAGSDLYILYATFLSFFSGLILFVGGLLNGGFIVENLLSVPLLMGWIQGAALLIVLSQASGFFQIHIPSTSNTVVTLVKSIASEIKSTNVWSVLIGSVCLILLFGTRKISEYERFQFLRKVPLSLLVLIGVTLLTKFLHWDTKLDIAIIGVIPQGLPHFGFFSLSWSLILASFKAAMAIAIIGFMEGISLAKKFAGLRKYRIDVSQELRALGLANIIGSCFKAFPVTGSVTRTTVNYQSGSRTTYSSVVNGILVGAVLLFLAPLFYYTPKATLAAIVISAGLSLIDIGEIRFLWRIRAKWDMVQLFAILLITLFTGPEIGAVFAILISVILIVYRATKPACHTLGQVAGTTVYNNSIHARSTARKGILIVRIESGLYFYTVAWLKENLFTWENDSSVPLKALVMDASTIESADSSGIHGITELIEQYKKKDICVFFSNLSDSLFNTFLLSGIIDKIGHDAIFGTTHEAVQAAQGLSYSEGSKLTVTLNVN